MSSASPISVFHFQLFRFSVSPPAPRLAPVSFCFHRFVFARFAEGWLNPEVQI
jgi:hypothetical protein